MNVRVIATSVQSAVSTTNAHVMQMNVRNAVSTTNVQSAVSMTNAHVLTMNARSADSMTNGHALPVTERSTFAKATPMPRAKANGRINSKTAVPRRSSAAIGMSLSRPPSHRTTLRRTRKNPSGIFLPRRRRSANAARLLQRDKTGISINRIGSVMS